MGGQIPYTRVPKQYHRWQLYGTRQQEVPGWKIFQVTNEKLKLGEQRRKYVYVCLGIVVIDSSIYIHVYALNYLSTYVYYHTHHDYYILNVPWITHYDLYFILYSPWPVPYIMHTMACILYYTHTDCMYLITHMTCIF